MKKHFVILIVISVVFASCGKKPTNDEVNVTEVDTTVYRVKTTVLEKQKVAQTIEYTANLIAYEEINYAPASPGRIEAINVEVGSHVRKGQLIVQMDQTQLMQAKEQYLNAKSNFQRMDTLHKLNSISEQAYEGTKTQYEVAKTNYEFLQRNTRLVSPINGIVTGKYFESGELYSGAPNTMAGKAAVVTLMQINPLKAKINLSEKYYPLLKEGMKSTVSVDIYPDQQFVGKIFRIYPTISPDTRTFPVEIVIKNPKEILRPGMYARVSLDLGEINTLVVPAIAVVKQEGTNERYIFLTNGNNTAHKVFVKIGKRYDDMLEIISEEVKEGDQIIIAGQEKLIEGATILIEN